ncbi:MAG: glycosyltransferase [Pedobacter sp.]|nr:MAG: glycosyltransferase [Pedobacter sp.]
MEKDESKVPLVSIICVTYNAEKHIKHFLKNIALYKSPFVELVIIDGQSTDNTVTILENNREIINFFLSEPDKGIYDAMNKAANVAKGKWLYFLGADDSILPDFGRFLNYLKDDSAIYYGNVVQNGKRIISATNKKNIARYNICHQAIFYPSQVFKKYKYDLAYKVNADYHLNILCFGDHNLKFVYHDLNIADHASGGYSANNVDVRFNKEKTTLIRQNLGLKTFIKYLWWKLKND